MPGLSRILETWKFDVCYCTKLAFLQTGFQLHSCRILQWGWRRNENNDSMSVLCLQYSETCDLEPLQMSWFLNEEASNRTGDRVASESTKVICSRILKGGVSMSRRTGCSSDFKSTQTCPSLHTHCTLMCLNCCSEDSSAARLSTMPMLGFIFATLAWSARSPGFQRFPSSFTARNVRESSIEGTSNLVDEVCPWKGTYGADGPKSYVLWRSMRDDAEGHHLSKWWFLC